MSSKLLVVVLICVNVVLWTQSMKQDEASAEVYTSKKCAPLSYPQPEQCPHVMQHCPGAQTLLHLPYLQSYFCAAPAVRPLAFGGLTLWLIFLFSMLGIGASDFFCPNLATIADVLGLDENVAGVTFLALGNGSPDVFSTFSAMKAQSGSLAVGELLGAATFIISVVVGSMCIIKPFHVLRYPFLRDVGFFTVAVTMLLVILLDGMIQAWEAGVLVLLYVVYVSVVVAGSWWQGRQDRLRLKEEQARADYAYDERVERVIAQPYRDEEDSQSDRSMSLAPPSITGRSQRAYSNPPLPTPQNHPPLQLLTQSMHLTPPPSSSPATRSRSHTVSSHHHDLPSFSLMGALEFRDVITSLHEQSASSALEIFDSPVTHFPAGHYRRRSIRLPSPSGLHRYSYSQTGTPRQPSALDSETDPWDAALVREGHGDDASERQLSVFPTGANKVTPVPSIRIDPADSPVDSINPTPRLPPVSPSKRQRLRATIKAVWNTLFPTLNHFREKSVMGMVAAVLATPAVFMLTLTLPVVVTEHDDDGIIKEGIAEQTPLERLVEFEEEGLERIEEAEMEYQEEIHPAQFNKWLIATQCALGPVFGAMVIFGIKRHSLIYILAAAISGALVATLTIIFADRGNDPSARLARCFLGFTVAVVWIMAIADEVVQVLQTFGHIFGLSDAIIGLTIFAVGNSLADFVANITVARFAPIMGFSACFGGPMLNILLGIGLSGTFIIRQDGGQPYDLYFSRTLFVSTIGLLALLVATLVFVPFNGYLLSKRWGIFLISCYVILMITNVVVEVKHEGRHH